MYQIRKKVRLGCLSKCSIIDILSDNCIGQRVTKLHMGTPRLTYIFPDLGWCQKFFSESQCSLHIPYTVSYQSIIPNPMPDFCCGWEGNFPFPSRPAMFPYPWSSGKFSDCALRGLGFKSDRGPGQAETTQPSTSKREENEYVQSGAEYEIHCLDNCEVPCYGHARWHSGALLG